MAFVPRSRATIRDTVLADWQARYATLGLALDVRFGTDAYFEAEAFALELEGLEAQAFALTKQILPDQADTDYLNRHGTVDGVARNPAVAAVLQVAITGTPGATVTFGSSTLQAAGGQSYGVSANADGSGGAVLLDGSGNGTAYATAQALGSAGNAPDGTVLVWSSAPTGANPTATVVPSGTIVDGEDVELDGSYAARIVARRQNRPASGNRADWLAWVLSVDGVSDGDAYIYPLYSATYGAGTPGCVTVVALGAQSPTDSPTNSRILSGPALARIAGFIEGTNDVHGGATPNGTQLRPVTMAAGDYSIEAAGTLSEDVDLQLVLDPSVPFPWAYSAGYVAVAGSTTTNVKIAGDITSIINGALTALPLLVHVGTTHIRGGYQKAAPSAVATYDGTNTNIPVAALLATPTTGKAILPQPPVWDQIRLATFGRFDLFGPGDSVSPSLRWPTQGTKGRSTLYRSSLVGAIVQEANALGQLLSGIQGVLSASVVTPSSDVTPAAKAIVTLGTLSVHP